ncbi:alpha/beta hydrolase [Streptomyces cavernicola]|uniref:Alpha/beta hydrolase n=1 Tax=Streptomyces cavernicola TaxID=3043613 RepID=A0ABT6SFM5_9ACTN|nr:alpha/beta hydrolase [Streptomyces sp. B-S-A6]MDI3406238.1 alpha/beta hydrolase [Streptomyces sp. B-S-A6]
MSPTRMLDCGMDHADILALRTLTDAGIPWDEATQRLAVDRQRSARTALDAGHRVTAHMASRSAAADLLFAQMAFNHDVPRKIELYGRFTEAVAAAGSLAEPAWEHVSLPFGSGRLFGWLVRPTGPVQGTVIVFGGQSGWGAAYLKAADALTARGLAAFLVEGPGQGQTRMTGGLLLDVDVRAAYSTFVDHVLADPSLGGRVGLWGNSMGGLFAATTAAADARVGAVCVNGAPARPRLLGMRTFDDQAAAMLGTSDPAAVTANFERLALRPEDRISGSVLVLHGGQDPIVTLEEQQPFLDAGPAGSTLRVWDDGEHTIYNHADEKTAYVADWFTDHLRGGKE